MFYAITSSSIATIWNTLKALFRNSGDNVRWQILVESGAKQNAIASFYNIDLPVVYLLWKPAPANHYF